MPAGPVRLEVREFSSAVSGRLPWDAGKSMAAQLGALRATQRKDRRDPRTHSSKNFRVGRVGSPGKLFGAISFGRRLLTDIHRSRGNLHRADGTKETYDDQGRLIERNQQNGNTIILRYDAAGNLAQIDGPFHSSLRFFTDSAGCLTRVEGSNGAAVRYFYADPERSAPAAEVGQLVSYSYDDAGHLRRINDPRGSETLFSYDEKGRVTKRRWSDEAEERFEYDDSTNTRRFIDAAGNVTTTPRQLRRTTSRNHRPARES